MLAFAQFDEFKVLQVTSIMDIDFNKFSAKTWIAIILLWVTVICSGILFLFLFKTNLFTTLDTIKLILLSSAIATPIWLFNCIIILFSFEQSFTVQGTTETDFLSVAIRAALFSIPIFYIPLLIKFFFTIPSL